MGPAWRRGLRESGVPVSPGHSLTHAHHEKNTGYIRHPVRPRTSGMRGRGQFGPAPTCPLLRTPVPRRHPGDLRLRHDRRLRRHLFPRRLVVEAVGRAVVQVPPLRPRLEPLQGRARVLPGGRSPLAGLLQAPQLARAPVDLRAYPGPEGPERLAQMAGFPALGKGEKLGREGLPPGTLSTCRSDGTETRRLAVQGGGQTSPGQIPSVA